MKHFICCNTFIGESNKYHYFYRITNTINNKTYYGIHSTSNINDNYCGSGKLLYKAYNKYGVENFIKEILICFNTRKECSDYEHNFVNENFIKDLSVYNIKVGGDGWNNVGYGTFTNGIETCSLNINDTRIKTGEFYGCTKGKGLVVDPNTKTLIYMEKSNPLYDIYEHCNKGISTLRDADGNIYKVSINDPRKETGKLFSIWKGKHHTDETKNIIW